MAHRSLSCWLWPLLALPLAGAAAAGCGDKGSEAGGDDAGPAAAIDAGAPAPDAPPADEWEQRLAGREYDYGAALRTAALRLTGDLPTLAEIKFVADAVDKKSAYEALVEAYLADPRFARQMVAFWRDTLRTGGADTLESAPVFAAEVVVEDRPYTDLLTATAGTCPTFDAASGAFTPGDCQNGVPVHAGLLSHPGVMKQFVSNLAFRRVRWVQETFDCTAFPAEVTAAQDIGAAAVYTSPWSFTSIAGLANGGRIDFLDTSSVICANCHTTMNHMAPLFGHFDRDGTWSEGFAVTLPTDGLPTAMLSDWLPPGETTAWRFGVPAPDLPALGAAMAADPAIAECAVARSWNWAFGKGDIVNALAVVPAEVIADQVAAFRAGGFHVKPMLFAVFTADDFVKY